MNRDHRRAKATRKKLQTYTDKQDTDRHRRTRYKHTQTPPADIHAETDIVRLIAEQANAIKRRAWADSHVHAI